MTTHSHPPLDKNGRIEKARAVCVAHGERFTPLRAHIFELLVDADGPIKAYDLLEQLRPERGSPKPPTVYRALEFLQESGLVHKISSLNAYVGCGHPLTHRDCFFLICSDCNEVEECCGSSVAETLRDMATKQHFTPHHTTLEIEGTCQTCQAAS